MGVAAKRSSFVYVTYIRTTPTKLWEALTDPQIIPRYRLGTTITCDWKKGSPWKIFRPDGSLADSGEILEIDPPRRVVIRWQNEWKPEFKAEGPSCCTIELELGRSRQHRVRTADVSRSGDVPARLRGLRAGEMAGSRI